MKKISVSISIKRKLVDKFKNGSIKQFKIDKMLLDQKKKNPNQTKNKMEVNLIGVITGLFLNSGLELVILKLTFALNSSHHLRAPSLTLCTK